MSTIRKVPVRQCIGCGEKKSKRDMIRILRTTEETIILDEAGRQNGRGAYLCGNPDCLKKAVKSKGLERALKTVIPHEVYENLEKEIEKLAEK